MEIELTVFDPSEDNTLKIHELVATGGKIRDIIEKTAKTIRGLKYLENGLSTLDETKQLRIYKETSSSIYFSNDGRHEFTIPEMLQISKVMTLAVQEVIYDCKAQIDSKLIITYDTSDPNPMKFYVLEVQKRNSDRFYEHVGYMNVIFVSEERAANYYKKHNPHMRIMIDGISDWDLRDHRRYRVRTWNYEVLNVPAWNPDDSPTRENLNLQ